jgi:hypothetical protein
LGTMLSGSLLSIRDNSFSIEMFSFRFLIIICSSLHLVRIARQVL